MTRNRLIASFVLACLALPAYAATVTVSWTNPTSYTDGSVLAAADIVSHRVQWSGSCPDFSFVAPENNIVVQGNGTQLVLNNVTPGNRCFRAFVSARTVGCVVSPTETCVRESLASNVFSKTVSEVPKTPRPPSILDAIVAWLKSIFGRFA